MGFRTVIVLRGREEEHRQSCSDVKLAAVHTCRYCIPYENDMAIYVCRGIRVPAEEIWQAGKAFE